MNRATYVKHLEHDVDASQKVINDLTHEIHDLREQLNSALKALLERSKTIPTA